VGVSQRPGAGRSQLKPLRDGPRILWTSITNRWRRPETRKICFLIDSVYPYNNGGRETFLYETSRRLARHGHQVHIFTMNWWNGPKVIQREGVYFHAICRRYPLYKNDRRSVIQAAIFGVAALKLAFVDFYVLDADQIPYFCLFSAKLVCLAKRKPMYATWHEVWDTDYWQAYLGSAGRLASLVERLAMRLPDVILSHSTQTTDRLKARGARQLIHTIPQGVDVDSILATPRRVAPNDIIYAGRLLKHKNVDILIRSTALVKREFPNVICTIVGDGPESKALQLLAAQLELGGNVRFQSFYENHSDLYALMKASKVFVLPSTREGFGLVVVEANACGIPVITTNHEDNAARLLIDEGKNGLLVDVDVVRLAETIGQILQGGLLIDTSAVVGSAFAAFDWDVAAGSVEEALGTGVIQTTNSA
jgi:glycosyltransferase involved in cell wall biosynthesis